jgi:methionine aminopeptidase
MSKHLHVSCTRRFNIIPQYCGHGVGTIFHASPMILHNRNNERDKMQLWQTFTIEPILCTGSPRHHTWPDKWTVCYDIFQTRGTSVLSMCICKLHTAHCTLQIQSIAGAATATSSRRHEMGDVLPQVVTNDGGLTAQYEHTVLITPEGAEVLTLP